ncbi:hypothetical protein VFPFJ_01128 [Purpureocillium lilacinum]|uniref:Uncharacterized protein n=1 Tax=Purpureocillium lilacinum TaxID=33203 RepID=A0A179I021_PURLI|nr:hypothetical protein VFPFJ_01128 [Purpureocillium lilacinum]OAQ95019.1 hypothetical protein VFPFJ_01128 [Purpureocillium lilacinum]
MTFRVASIAGAWNFWCCPSPGSTQWRGRTKKPPACPRDLNHESTTASNHNSQCHRPFSSPSVCDDKGKEYNSDGSPVHQEQPGSGKVPSNRLRDMPSQETQGESVIRANASVRRILTAPRDQPVGNAAMIHPSVVMPIKGRGRGLPLGFVSALEKRLAETENALYRVIQGSPVEGLGTVQLDPTSHSKGDRLNEWKNFPLNSMEDILAWCRWKALEQDGNPTSPIQTSLDEEHHHISGPSDRNCRRQSLTEGTLTSAHPATAHMASRPNDLVTSKAEKLSRTRPGLYF